ncbi:hemin-degrading factor [Roseateles aquatilis]|uniref:Hemin-degrading factor n=1 Tax=Roseateles aquatilis TaxID=431061 RepID=A0A246JLY7_9BURK|nr:ChuX/HutX family heme-like substrate-binding protein [Roseateles aquatilis]OWQ93622.1 hemin-degrading factor [Roseateles aquatilis]
MQASFTALRHAFATARQERKARHRDIASALSISEGELLAAHIGPFADDESPLRARRLRAEWQDLIAALEPLGPLMALTRNESCVHEKVGVYQDVSAQGPQRLVGLVLGGAIDLRVFYSHWRHGVAVAERLSDGALQRSLQFFDAAGLAIHKVFLRPESDVAAYEALVARFLSDDQQPGLEPGEVFQDPAETPDERIDVATFRGEWASLRDTHEFFGLLKRHGLSRTQALRLAEPRFAQPLPLSSAQELLSRAAQEGVSIMVFVGNPGMIQIHSGPVHKVAMMGPWINVLDAGFNLHLREDHIASAWLVRKPTVDGLVCSLELFDAQGRTIAMLFGERKPGQAERCDWRNLLESLVEGAPEAVPC